MMLAQDCFESLHARTLREVRHLVGKVEKGSLESLLMADALQRLGIDYHFEEEMQSLLREQFFISTFDGHRASNNSLHEVALCFRLLLQEGYYVPADIFEDFKKNNGGCAFDPKLSKDVFGLMSLHEASHLGTHGEGVLDEAADFTRTALSGLADKFLYVGNNHINGMSSQLLGELVRNTLSNPIHKSLPRFTSKSFEVYLKGHYHYEWTGAFRELAILDADLTASINQTEIQQISK
ncbi:hypothetical protein CDL15_Pgr000308 [Punica granatum]|uniref:Terpene synthase N-terminal domain-containing protein n=1 Tax=Punica granatum TaxID=22663 RepID=A0A218Y2D1_PUNGR|nr:hypothetical protein CDL15_Pgr000308 [Punica granatum]PKI45169.1 hypothetical protein CRG98_034442 [Punica granatum]